MIMERFISVPNLPDGKVTLAAVGAYPEITEALQKEGIKTVSFVNSTLPAEISKHQDMLLCHIGDCHIFADPSLDVSCLTELGFSVYSSVGIMSEYPFDVKLNVAVSDDYYICNSKHIDKHLSQRLILSGRQSIHTNQGYAKCSVCFVTNKAVITDDISIYKALKNTPCDVLLISKGDIYLSDKHIGFFGGSTGKIDKNTLAVTGSLRYHRDETAILQFCEKHEVQVKELTEGRITDIGGILPLTEGY